VDLDDLTCASAPELDRLDPAALDDVHLAEAFESAAGLREDSRTVPFAAALARRDALRLSRLDLPALFAPLVRSALAADRPGEALDWLNRAAALGAAGDGRTFDIWRAEVHARSGDPDAAMATYQALLARAPASTALALDAAWTMLDNGFEEHARIFLRHASDQAEKTGDAGVAARVALLIDERLDEVHTTLDTGPWT
jgi:hypothetical protein